MGIPTKSGSKTASKKTSQSDVAEKAAKPVKATAAKEKLETGMKSAAKARTVKKATGSVQISPEQKRYYVEVAAYYIAERRGFSGGSEVEDWTQAESEIDRLLSEGVLKP